MAYPANLKKITIPSRLNDSASIFFNNYIKSGFTISADLNDVLISHFEKITENKASAEIMASAVIYTSVAQRVNPIEIIQKMQGMQSNEVATYVSMFLNLNRLGSSYLGSRRDPGVNKYIKRSVRPESGKYFDGSSPEKAAPNAVHIKNLTGTNVNGNYWIRGCNDIPMSVYCDMNGTEAQSSLGGWIRFDHPLVSAYRNSAILDKLKSYAHAGNGAYSVTTASDSVIKGIRWDLGPNIKFSGIRVQLYKFDCVNGQDGWAGIDGPIPNWVGQRPTDSEVTNFFENNFVMGTGPNAACFGVSAGNGYPGPKNLARLYKGRLNNTEWPDQYVGIVTLSAGSFWQYDNQISNGRFIYHYESDNTVEYNNIQQYRIWLR